MAARRNISLPEDLDEAARAAGLNVSALTQQAIVDALNRQTRMGQLDAWLDELDAEHGPPSAEAVAEAEAWLASAVPVVAADRRAGRLSAAALEEVAVRARTVASRSAKGGVARTSRVVRDGKSGSAKTNRAAASGAKTTSRSALSQAEGRRRKAKR